MSDAERVPTEAPAEGDPVVGHRPLHAVDRPLDVALAVLDTAPAGAFLHCLQQQAASAPVPPSLLDRFPTGRWIPPSTHPLTFVDPSDHVLVHQAWLEACHGPDRVAHADVRTVLPLEAEGGEPLGDVGRYHAVLVDLIGTPDIDTVVVILTPLSAPYDIAAVAGAQQVLPANDLDFRTLAESLPVGVTVLDQEGRVHFANHRLVSLLLSTGLAGPESASPTPAPVGEGFVTSWSQLVAPELADQVHDLVHPTSSTAAGPGAARSKQVEVTGPSGFPVNLLVQAVTVRHQETTSVIVSVQDVTQEVRTSRAHSRLVQVVDEVDDAVIVTRRGGEVSYLNQAARRFLGDQAIGHPLQGYVRAELRQLIDEEIGPALERSDAWRGDIELVDRQGQRLVMATTVSPVRDPNGTELHVGITMRDVTAERAHERELAWLARHDALTGLPNRLSLMERLEACGAEGAPDDDIAIFFVDLDNLKIVNDGVGHSAGDRLLVAVADELARTAGADQVARFGGDEFVIISEHVAADEALERAEQLLHAVRSAHIEGVATHVSASIGVATATRRSVEPEALVRNADAAMYEAKRAGRSRCVLFDEPLRQRVTRRFQMESALRRAIERDELAVAYQPIVSLADGTTTGVEALCRWDLGSPSAFISVAEESGLIVPLGIQVLDKALDAAQRLRSSVHHRPDLGIGINVSARELDHPDFASRVLASIDRHGLAPADVVLELTESVLIDQRDDIVATLSSLRDAGVALALDDFGSGYSSLTYLRRYPIDILKLDISYTQAMVEDSETRVIVESLVSMATRLGLDVVAEGVETIEQMRLAKDLGARWVQGYLVGRPASLNALLAAPPPQHPDLTTLDGSPTPTQTEPGPPAP